MQTQYPLDGVSTIFPALHGYIYRFSAVLKEAIDEAALRRALQYVLPYYPILCTHLQRTTTGYVHVPATDLDILKAGQRPLEEIPITDTKKPMLRLYYAKKGWILTFFTPLVTAISPRGLWVLC